MFKEWLYNHCHTSYYPNQEQKVKRANKFETPGQQTDVHGNITGEKTPWVSMIDDTPNTNKSRLPPSIEMLKRPGVKITDFHSTIESESL